jgi:hypothetical protein
MEIWKDIKGYEGTYKISSNGRILSLKRSKVKEDRILDSYLSSEGYHTIKLTQFGKCKSHKIHQLVAINFLGHTPNGYVSVVDHIDRNVHNNCLSNLRVISQRENAARARINNNSKFRGVSIDKKRNKFYATIKILSKSINLGTFNCETIAHFHYAKAVQLISEFINPKQFKLLINTSFNK